MHPLPLLFLALCFLAHVTGDFVLQTEAIVKGKQSSDRVLLWHVVQHVLALCVLLPAGSLLVGLAARGTPSARPTWGELAVIVAGVAVTHWAIDKTKILIDRRRGGSATSYVLDQIAHVVAIGVLVTWLRARHDAWPATELATWQGLGRSWSVTHVAAGILLLASYVYAARAGAILAWMVTLSLTRDRTPEALAADGIPAYPLRDGRTLALGYLERLLGLTCVLWGWLWALALLLGGRLAPVARRALRRRDSSIVPEYRLLEVLCSLSTVLVVGVVVRMLLR
jgi:hypothetical protein